MLIIRKIVCCLRGHLWKYVGLDEVEVLAAWRSRITADRVECIRCGKRAWKNWG
jgi:hypothetical protein